MCLGVVVPGNTASVVAFKVFCSDPEENMIVNPLVHWSETMETQYFAAGI